MLHFVIFVQVYHALQLYDVLLYILLVLLIHTVELHYFNGRFYACETEVICPCPCWDIFCIEHGGVECLFCVISVIPIQM